jgi:hypothetical protein
VGSSIFTLCAFCIGFPLFYPLLYFNSQVLLFIAAAFAGGAITVFSIILGLLKARKIPFWSGLWNTFVLSISTNFFLKNKLGVCKDYAKLTACLLFKIYPDAELHFVHAPRARALE